MNFNNTLGNLSALLSNSSIGNTGNNYNDESLNGANFNHTQPLNLSGFHQNTNNVHH